MNKDNLSDERLVVSHQKKRMNAFFIIYKRYHNYGFAIIHRNLEKCNLVNALKDEKDAILYDSIIEALSAFDKTRGKFRNFLSSVINNQTTTYIREFQKDPLSDYISLDASINEGKNLRFMDSLTFADKSETPQEVFNYHDNARKVEINLDKANKRRSKKMIELKQLGYSYREIAKMFKTSEGAIRAVFYRLKRRIGVKEDGRIKK